MCSPFVCILRSVPTVSVRNISVRWGSYTRPALNSNVSPFLGTAKAPLILLTAISTLQQQRRRPQACPSCNPNIRKGHADECGIVGGGADIPEAVCIIQVVMWAKYWDGECARVVVSKLMDVAVRLGGLDFFVRARQIDRLEFGERNVRASSPHLPSGHNNPLNCSNINNIWNNGK